MKKFGSWLFAIIVVLCCCLCCSCSNKESAKNENPEEYYEIEYQDGSGVHLVKAMYGVGLKDITIFETYVDGDGFHQKEWEYSNIVHLLYHAPTIKDNPGSFDAIVSQNATNKYFGGGMRLYYDEGVEDILGEYCGYGDAYNSLYAKNIPIHSISLENENIIISNQTLNRFSFISIPQSDNIYYADYYVNGYDVEDNLIYVKTIMVLMTVGYGSSSHPMNITLLEEGDFTTIKRKDMSDITIRTENILRKVKAEKWVK